MDPYTPDVPVLGTVQNSQPGGSSPEDVVATPVALPEDLASMGNYAKLVLEPLSTCLMVPARALMIAPVRTVVRTRLALDYSPRCKLARPSFDFRRGSRSHCFRTIGGRFYCWSVRPRQSRRSCCELVAYSRGAGYRMSDLVK